MTTTIPDADRRKRALDPECSFIVQAPAGSGKTELLIQRYLTLLARVEQPESVVAITFTRKAAGEMQRRMMKALLDGVGPRPEADHAALTWELARAVLDRDKALGWDLFRNPSRLRVRTIDSLSASITRQMPWVSRLGAPPEIVEDASDLYAEAARHTIELLEGDRWTAPVEALLVHLDNDFQTLRKLIAEMLKRRDQWLRHVVGAPGPVALRAQLEAALDRAIRDGVAYTRATTPPELAGEIVSMAAFGGSNAGTACAGIGALPDDGGIEAWLAIADMLLTGKDEWRKTANKNQGFSPANQPMKDRCLTLLADLAAEEKFRLALAELRVLPAARYDEPQWRALEALLEVLPVAVAELQVEFRRAGVADYAEVSLAALRALGEDGDPTELALRLDYQIRHLLVDEFQDTSVSQYTLLERLTAGWEPGDGRTVFAVGDPMQSIYRFREAMVGLFLKACEEGIGDVKLEPLRLSANFRSDEGIVTWVNATFPDVLPVDEDIATGAIPFRRSDPVRDLKLNPAVVLHAYVGRDDKREAADVVELVRTAQGRGAKTVAILVRARTHLPAILRALGRAGLRFRAVEIDGLAGVPLIQDLMALTRALLHPADRIAWLGILRAPWCGLTLEGLHKLAGGRRGAAVWDLMHDESLVQTLDRDERDRLLRVRVVLESTLAHRCASLRQWVEGTWLALGGPACAAGVSAVADAATFLDLLERLDRGGAIDVDELEEGVKRLYAHPDAGADESLQVMTVHKAKGLEFDVVILPGLGRKPRNEDSRLMLWQERPQLGADPDLLLAPLPATGAGEDTTYNYLKRIEARKAEFEAGRMLYVAATRARSELHLLGHTGCKNSEGIVTAKPPDAASLLRRMWTAAEPDFAAVAAAMEVPADGDVEVEARVPKTIERLTLGWQRPAPPAAVATAGDGTGEVDAFKPVSFRWVGDTLRHTGTVVHQMMRRIAEDGLDRWDAARVESMKPAYGAALAALGVPEVALAGAANRVCGALVSALAEERGRWVLGGGASREAACELPVCGVLDGETVSVRIDRTFVDRDGVRWIIDYKTSSHEGAGLDAFLDNERERYRGQLEQYRRLFGQWEQRPVRAGLYFPLLREWREIGPATSAIP
jgi:ATP-dependent exoDNAse (exonuclease V) beta subunit